MKFKLSNENQNKYDSNFDSEIQKKSRPPVSKIIL